MQVKLFSRTDITEVEKEVNEFLQTVKQVVDIKFSSSDRYTDVMVIYIE